MEIKTTNDGKQKAQSCDAEIFLTSESTYWGFYELNLKGYGANEWSAKMNLIQQSEDLILKLKELINKNK
jgi:hypothetical protein